MVPEPEFWRLRLSWQDTTWSRFKKLTATAAAREPCTQLNHCHDPSPGLRSKLLDSVAMSVPCIATRHGEGVESLIGEYARRKRARFGHAQAIIRRLGIGVMLPWSHSETGEKSLHPLQKLPRLAQQVLYPLSLGDLRPGEQPVLARVPVAPWRAGSRRTAMHAAAFFAVHGVCAALATRTEFGAATRVVHLHSQSAAHRAALDGLFHDHVPLPLGAHRASAAAGAGFLSDTITFACCVTLPTMALPPSATDTFCTVMAGSPRPR